MTKLLIAGATGLVGSLVLKRALADPGISHVVALTRRPIASHAKLENVVIDLADLPVEAPWWSVDGVVLALGTTRAKTRSPSAYRTIDFEYPLAIARRTRKNGATRCALTSALGADPSSRFFYTRTKGELEVELTNLDFPSLTIVRPSVLDGHREEHRTAECLAITLFKMLSPVLPRQWRVSAASAVAASLIEGAVKGPPGIHFKTNEDM